jgi:hypothetical protein
MASQTAAARAMGTRVERSCEADTSFGAEAVLLDPLWFWDARHVVSARE